MTLRLGAAGSSLCAKMVSAQAIRVALLFAVNPALLLLFKVTDPATAEAPTFALTPSSAVAGSQGGAQGARAFR